MSRLIDLTRQRFGMLTVLGRAKSRDGKVRWTCRCDCGNITFVRLDSITSGHIQSCGCQESKGKTEKMRKAAGFIDGTQDSKILKSLEHNASAADENLLGVNYDPKIRKWRATITFQGIRRRLGYYDTPREAAQTRKKAEKELFCVFLDELGLGKPNQK